jgi:hypothetical protein
MDVTIDDLRNSLVYSVALCLTANGVLWKRNIVTLPILLPTQKPVAISSFSDIFDPKEGRIIIIV